MTIRIPESLFQKLKAAARLEIRSVSDYIVVVLTEQTGDIDPNEGQDRST